MAALPVLFAGVVLVATAAPSHADTSVSPEFAEPFSILRELGLGNLARPCNQEDNPLVTLVSEVKEAVAGLAEVVKTLTPPRHCKDLLDAGDNVSGVRVIHPYPKQATRQVEVYCDQTTDGGGWTVFQRRRDVPVRENFHRTWAEYKKGFGNLEQEFWLGLDNLHLLTSDGLQELRIDLADWEGERRFAKYGLFKVGDEASKYLLEVGRHSGTAKDSFANIHSGQKFSTYDSDNDATTQLNCAQRHRGAWWYNECHHSNLNGFQHRGSYSETQSGTGINWFSWHDWRYSLKETSMMIRPGR